MRIVLNVNMPNWNAFDALVYSDENSFVNTALHLWQSKYNSCL